MKTFQLKTIFSLVKGKDLKVFLKNVLKEFLKEIILFYHLTFLPHLQRQIKHLVSKLKDNKEKERKRERERERERCHEKKNYY